MALQGTVIKDRFRIESLLEETERSFVFQGQLVGDADPDVPGQEIVIKVLKERYVTRPGFLEGYARELQRTARLPGNAHVVRYLDADLCGKRFLVVSVRFPGVSVGREILEGRRLSYRSLLGVGLGLARVLEFARLAGLPSRHVRLEDVLVDPDTGAMKLLKFSTPLASRIGGAGDAAGDGVAGDLLLIGTSLFRMVCLDYPTDRWDRPASTSSRQLAETLKAHHGDEISPEDIDRFVTLFRRLTTRRIEDRITSPEEVAADLELLEAARARLVDYRRRRIDWEKRQDDVRTLATAYDTVAALRGVLRPVWDPEPTLEPGPGRAAGEPAPRARSGALALAPAPAGASAGADEHRALLWAREPGPAGGLLARWDSPTAIGALTSMGLALFLATLYLLMF